MTPEKLTKDFERWTNGLSAHARFFDKHYRVEIAPGLMAAMKAISDFKPPRIEIPQIEIPRAFVDSLLRSTHQIGLSIRDFAKKLEPQFANLMLLAKLATQCNNLEESGWLPHYTSPFSLLSETEACVPELREQIAEYYSEHWSEVRAQFEEHLDRYTIDDDAKSIFRQALVAHESKLYALVPRALFPEIERVARAELHDGERGGVTNQKRLKEFAGQLGLSEIEPGGFFGAALFRRLISHVYLFVDDDTSTAIANDPVPNRHAVLHGYYPYNTAQSSINSLIMADYIFQVFDAIKRNRAELEKAADAA